MTDTATTSIRTRGLTRTFGDITAVSGLDLELPAHGVIGFVGPNGSGKSTTIRMLLGLIKATEGEGEVLGEPITHPERYADRVGALIENPAFIANISGRANVGSMALLRGAPSSRVETVLRIVDLADRADSRVSEYSLGMKQRLAIAIALLPDPELLILDEPTNGLDPAGIVEVRALIRQLADEGRTVVVSSHLLSEIEAAADHLVVIRSGQLLYSGPLAELLEQEQRYVDVEPEDPADLDRLAAAYDVQGLRIEREDGGYRVGADPTEAGRLNRIAADAGILLRRVEPHSETLEDVFLRMTDGS
ncbi:MAG: ATP-binding cassette domain-containing protein, partial [Candidatus Limnocylindrales bacterium]